MGIDYYVVCDDRREQFELGKGAWGGLAGRGGLPPDYNEVPLALSGEMDIEQFCDHVVVVWDSGHVERPTDQEYMRRVGRNLWEWCTERGWKVRLGSDHDGDWDKWLDYATTGTRFHEEEEIKERPLLSPRLKDLPITREDTYYGQSGDEYGIARKYLAELGKIRTPKGLKRFVQRWRVLWLLERVHGDGRVTVADDALVSGRFNAKKVLRTLRKMTPTYRTVRKSSHWRVAANLKAPYALVRGTLVANRYSVPEDVALIQLYQGVEFF